MIEFPPPQHPSLRTGFSRIFFISFLFFFFREKKCFFWFSKGIRGYRTNPFSPPHKSWGWAAKRRCCVKWSIFFLKKGIKTFKKNKKEFLMLFCFQGNERKYFQFMKTKKSPRTIPYRTISPIVFKWPVYVVVL